MGSGAIRRFYKSVTIEEGPQGYRVLLDKRALKSAGRHLELLLPHEGLARALAAEWREQGENVLLNEMPVMRLVSKVCDQVLPDPDSVRSEIIKYARSDLLCYRAEYPDALVHRQKKLWDPVLALFHQHENIVFRQTRGIGWIDQSEEDMQRFANLLQAINGYELGALHAITVLTGSALLAMALARGWRTVDEVWTLCHLDEDFQIEQWGEDDEARQSRERRHRDYTAAALVFNRA